MRRTERKSPDDDPGDTSLAELMRQVELRMPPQETPAPARARDTTPYVDKPPTLRAAEADLFRAEMALRLRSLFCEKLTRCEQRACRRSGRCRELMEIEPLVAQARATLAREMAQWQLGGRNDAEATPTQIQAQVASAPVSGPRTGTRAGRCGRRRAGR